MDITKRLDEIISLLKDSSFSNLTAVLSIIVAVIAIVVNIVSGYKNHKQYIESLKPLLAFDLYEMNGFLILSIKNVGQSEARSIKLHIKHIKNNGDKNEIYQEPLFNSDFMLYPSEEVQGVVAVSGGNIACTICPAIDISISFQEGNDNQFVEYSRTIHFKRNIYTKNRLSKIEDSIESISYSNNRIANYIEGRTLFTYDKINVMPHNSLYKDMQDAFNNVKREDKKE